ncbi:hypothetical protein GCM10022409_07000 [Hymenobacter glaciei]|uniref:Uncharacterized protein n=1 Tax=Hymenobacter glaciei TaxID=877209 RepID=A0ABP7TFN5_9BACT
MAQPPNCWQVELSGVALWDGNRCDAGNEYAAALVSGCIQLHMAALGNSRRGNGGVRSSSAGGSVDIGSDPDSAGIVVLNAAVTVDKTSFVMVLSGVFQYWQFLAN